MSDNKILQSILDTVISIRKDFKRLEDKMDKGFEEVNKRIDTLSKDLAYLEDDSPTREEYGNLEKRVRKIEKKLSLN